MTKTRTVTFEVRIDVTRDDNRTIGDEVQYALGYLLLTEGRMPKGEWIEVPYSLSDFNCRGPTHVRLGHKEEES